MYRWFKEDAPIARKLSVAFGMEFCLVGATAAAGLLLPCGSPRSLAVYGGALAISGVAGVAMRRAIAFPYRTTVVRMEALADGEIDTPINYTDFKDCVGRMARAMHKFRAAAIARREAEDEAAAQRKMAAQFQELSARQEDAARTQTAVVTALRSGLQQLAAGSLVARLDEPFGPDYEQLRVDFNAAVARLESTMGNISESSGAIRSGSEELSRATDDLSRRTEQQAASLEETAAALDEITATVRRTAENAGQAREAAALAKTDVEKSETVVREAVEAMGGIETSSQQIGQIIGVIDEIAFQTNLLALNAGVEAARAGEAGRGFAVVASEVRALAQRSADAAKEIKNLISASGRQVEAGVQRVGQMGTALTRIMTQITELNSAVGQIAASAHEQATGLQEVNAAVNQMDQVTQQNAAMVEQSTAASHGLTQDAQRLASLVGQFKISLEHINDRRQRTPRHDDAMEEPARARTARPRSPAPVAALKTIGRGGAARKLEPASNDDAWEEF